MQNIIVRSSGMPRKQNFEISGGRYFQMAKTYTSHGHLKLQKMWKEHFLKKGNVYPVLLELWMGMSNKHY